MLGFDAGAEFPDEGAEFTGHGNFDFVMLKLSLAKSFEAVAETGLGFPGEFPDPSFGTLLSFGKLSADFGRNAVVGGLFDQ